MIRCLPFSHLEIRCEFEESFGTSTLTTSTTEEVIVYHDDRLSNNAVRLVILNWFKSLYNILNESLLRFLANLGLPRLCVCRPLCAKGIRESLSVLPIWQTSSHVLCVQNRLNTTVSCHKSIGGYGSPTKKASPTPR